MTLEHKLRIACSGLHGEERITRMVFFMKRKDLLNRYLGVRALMCRRRK